METLLIDEWLRGTDDVLYVYDDASLSVARDRVRALVKDAGLDPDIADRGVLVASELGRNQLRHATAGRLAFRVVARGDVRGIEILAADRGRGLADPATALEGAPRTSGSLGVGVAAARELSTEIDFDVRVGEGTLVCARLFPRGVARGREIGIYGRPHEGELVSGDDAFVRRDGVSLVVGVCDGLGHGPLAREAAVSASVAFAESGHRGPVEILEACHEALAPTRGAVMAVARIDDAAGELATATVGNITVSLCTPRAVRRFGGASSVLGSPRPGKPRLETVALNGGEILVMTTDGISARLTIEQDLALLREHAVVIAQRCFERFGRSNDDALVLVAR